MTANTPLPLRVLGRTGVTLPVLGLGTSPLGHRPADEAVAFIHCCLDAGLTHLDTGPDAGGFGRAQTYIGRVLKERRRDVFLATRCSEPDGEAALAQLRRNLAELQVERADLVYVQSLGDDRMAPERIYAGDGVCRALERARRDGLARWLGVSGHCRPGRFLTALREWDFDVMLTAASVVSRHVYDFERRVWPLAAARGIGLVAMKVFGGVRDGTRSAKGALLDPELLFASLRHVLGQPGVGGVLVGLLDAGELARTLDWMRAATPLTPAELRALEEPTRALARAWGEPYGPRD